MTEPQIAIITTCKGRLEHLKQTLPEHTKHAPVVLIDCGCPEKCGEWAEGLPAVENSRFHTQVMVTEMQLFHKTLALNLGAAIASNLAPWLMFVDADVTVDIPSLPSDLDPQSFYIAAKEAGPDYSGFLLVHRALFWGPGGFDTMFNTWGGEDLELRVRLFLSGLKPVRLDQDVLSAIEHTDEERTKYLPSQDKKASLLRNFNYISYKLFHFSGSEDLFKSDPVQDLLELRRREEPVDSPSEPTTADSSSESAPPAAVDAPVTRKSTR